ncbi:hypothetical protein K449DRAFT_426433 [Hypoxylon sp. EC38]|nr:hypothetical protein K449DRAFT_426433 [Hypoxylon sp. EC38]
MPSSQQQTSSTPWQDRLAEVCREYQIQAPHFQIVSDRRVQLAGHQLAHSRCLGGRTAWSSIVTVYGKRIEARYWYDGRNITNAREDAAEAALNWLSTQANLSTNW